MSASGSTKAYSMLSNPQPGTTGTGYDQIVNVINFDSGLAGANTARDIAGGAEAANRMNHIIVEAINVLGAFSDGSVSVTDVVQINAYIRANYLQEWTDLHGDDENGQETGFHLVQSDGATTNYRGDNFIDTVADGIYHLGFEIRNGSFVNEDGNANATVQQMANWLTQFYIDHSTTGTGMDRIADLVMADAGLAANVSEANIVTGAQSANGISSIILQAINALNLGADGRINANDVVQISNYIRNNQTLLAQFIELHGDDENGTETGFHTVQNDGAITTMFGQNFVNTVADGIFHIGFSIQNGRFLNEDGDENATIDDVADWVDYFYSDQSTTGTGLDRIVDEIKKDTGLSQATNAGDINDGADSANKLNGMIIESINATASFSDGWIDTQDLVSMNSYVRGVEARFQRFLELHGDDEGASETGFHLVQNDGSTTQYMGDNLINTVADGLYHFGFEIQDGRFVNEDGDANASLEDVSAWLNYFYGGKTIIFGTGDADAINGTDDSEHILGGDGDDSISGGGNKDLIYGGWGDDSINGGDGDDTIFGQGGADTLDGGNGSDTFVVTGNEAGGWSSFQYFDSYKDTGAAGIDTIVAKGAGDVDVGLTGFGASSGIEQIDASGATGTVRLLGDWTDNTLDFRNVTFVGAKIVIDAGYGDDVVFGNAAANVIVGGAGADIMNGGDGGDTYIVTGNEAGGWSSFQYYDTYSDTGATGADTIAARGIGDVDVGLTGFGASSGIERIDASGATGTVRLLGDWTDNTLDFRNATFVGANIVIDGADGDDTIFGNSAANVIIGGGGADTVNGGDGGDTYVVTGNVAGGWSSFQYYDTYSDTGATGADTIAARGGGDVDVGFASFGQSSGIERIDATGAAGTVRLLGDWTDNTLDFRNATFLGTNIVIDGADGDDRIFGNSAANVIIGGGGADTVNGGDGGDTYVVTGNVAGGWSSFQYYDTYNDTGATGADTIAARGVGDVDVGFASFGQSSGIERIDATGATGSVRLLGDWTGNTLDFRNATFLGTNIVIDGADGDDRIFGNAAANVIIGGGGADIVNGGDGGDTYVVTGNIAGVGDSFQYYDTYNDTGATGTDTIAARGQGDVDVGFTEFGASSGIERIDASGATGTVRLLGDWTNNRLDFRTVTFAGSNIVIDGGDGDDRIFGNSAANVIIGGGGADTLNGGDGGDTYVVTGNVTGGWSSFQYYDTYNDTGATGTDTIAARGAGNVDIGFTEFGASSGIERIDASGATGTVRLLGDWTSNRLDFRTTTFAGSNIVIDGADGDDRIFGNAAANVIIGGGGADTLNGGDGGDTYVVTGNVAGGWSSFQYYDTYNDTGATGTDTIAAQGAGNVDIGFTEFGASSGIERIDASGATGTVRLLGDWTSNRLDFRTTTFAGSNIVIDGADGDDTIFGNAAANVIIGGGGADTLNGGDGGDTYVVTGNVAGGWNSFQYYDIYNDTGATGTDTIAARGAGNVDVGLVGFGSSTGIEQIVATGVTGTVRLLGDWTSNRLDFRTTTFLGTNIVIDGADGDDTIFGNAAANVIIGGGGADTLNGGDGGDTYVVTGNIAGVGGGFQYYDTYNDTGATGTDTIVARGAGNVDIGFVSFGSSTGIERIDSTGSTGTVRLLGDWTSNTLDFRNVTFVGANIAIDGGDGDDTVLGNTAANVLSGGGGADTLDGGIGIDTLSGGKGDDIFIIDLTSTGAFQDNVIEDNNNGRDTIRLRGASTNMTAASLNLFNNVENLDASATASSLLNLVGNALNNEIRGNAQSNVITGGAGTDELYGNGGNDIFVLTAFNDYTNQEVVDGGLGVDELRIALNTSATVKLNNRLTDVESIVIGTGEGANAVTSGAAAVNVNADSVNYGLTLNGNNGANQLIGTSFDDRIFGNSGDDTLSGGRGNDLLFGGIGNDVLNGDKGKDTFVFNTALNAATNLDRINDFNVTDDTIALAASVFSALGQSSGVLSADAFVIGTAAVTANNRIIYNASSGGLFYDANGNAAGGSVQFATLSTGLSMTNNDFNII